MSQPQQPRRRRWYQFSLRTLLIVVAAVAALAFAWIKLIEPYRLQREVMAVITKLGGTYKSEEAPRWIRYLVKDAQDIIAVDLADCDEPDEFLRHLARLPKVRTLVVGGHAVGDEQLTSLRKVANLRGLVLDSTKVSEDAIATLKETLPHLVVYKSERRAVAELEKLGATLSTRWASAYQEDALPLTPPQQATPPAWLYTDAGDAYFGDPSLVVVLKRADSSPFKEGLLHRKE